MSRYESSDRAYHDRRHLEECLEQLAAARHLLRRPDEAEAAIWFHDAVYDPRADDNEERSADLADDLLGTAGASTEDLAEIRRLILATGHRGGRNPQDDAAVVTDVDLSIFGSDPARFDEYERDIRREYAFATEADFRRRRAQILEAFLARPSIYATRWFIERLEAKARANLARSIEALRREPGTGAN
jgi:predicted metal-dependent HD superfamily phosphohydrolase